MYAHNLLRYTNGTHHNLSKVTMLLRPFWTNYLTHLCKPLMVANGKQKNTGLCVISVTYCGSVYAREHKGRASTVNSLNTGPSGCSKSSIGRWRYQQQDIINFTYTCRAYFFTFLGAIVIGINGLSELIMGIVSSLDAKKPSLNTLTQRWCISFFMFVCKNICEKQSVILSHF